MKYNFLGRSQLLASEIGLGCMSLEPGATGNKAVVDLAIEKGINFFDTADLYDKGENEIELGKLLGTRRKDLLVATKVGNKWRSDGSGWDWNAGKEYIITAVEDSLQRLQTDYIDLYQLHGGTIEDNIPEAIEAFELLVKQGKIRYYGISSIRPQVIRRWLELSNISTVMMQYSVLDRRPEEYIIGLLRSRNVSMLARGAVAKGLLAGKPATDYLGHSSAQVAAAAGAVRSAAEAIRFVLQDPVVSCAVVGMRTVEQCIEALAAAELSEEEMMVIRGAVRAKVYTDYR